MEDITNSFATYFDPTCALVFYQSKGAFNDTYVEYFDMENGVPINPHPLSVNEGKRLATALQVEENVNLLKSDGIIPPNLLSFDATSSTLAWYTKPQFRELFFNQHLGIKCGTAHVPALVWVADREELQLFALATGRKPTLSTALYHAPFFNVYEDGSVCMGTVDIQGTETGSITALMALWENYFFNSYFSHLMSDHNPVKGNCVMLWDSLIDNGKLFPTERLVNTYKKLKDILS